MTTKSKKSCQGRDTFERMSFLYQAAQLMSGKNNVISCYLGSQCKSISRKALLRMEPELKRTICKKCGLILRPDVTATLDISSEQNDKTKVCTIKCSKCGFSKRYVLSKNYSLWLDNEASIKEILEPDDWLNDQNKNAQDKEKAKMKNPNE